MPLTDTAVRNAKPTEKARKVADGGGLYLLVQPTGAKLWRWKYRFIGKEKLLALGRYPDVSLRQARERRDDARRLLADGIDPGVQRRQEKAQKAQHAESTFKAIANEWLAMRAESMAQVTYDKARWMLDEFAFPKLGEMPLAAIQPPDVLNALREVERSGRLETMHRTKARISEVFRYAIATGRATSDPCRDLRGALKPKRPTRHHAALTKPDDVGELMRVISGYRGTPEVCAALMLAPLLFVRPGELRHAEWSEMDLDGAQWRIPAGKMKMREPHIVPLPTQAVAILRDLNPLTGAGIPAKPDAPAYLFPSVRTRERPMSENTINAALRRLGYTGEEMTGHGFRAMARTLLAELGWKPDAIERQLAHKASGPLGAAYDRAQFLEERRRMMQAWADYLDRLAAGASKVVPIRAA